MKVVLNKGLNFGLVDIAPYARKVLGLRAEDIFYLEDWRYDEKLIGLIEKYGSGFISGRRSWLVVEEIPDNATDSMITRETNYEILVYIIDGKIYSN